MYNYIFLTINQTYFIFVADKLSCNFQICPYFNDIKENLNYIYKL